MKKKNDPNLLPYVCNQFIAQHLTDFLRLNCNTSQLSVLGIKLKSGFKNENLTYAVYLTLHFCHWLNVNKYSEH